MGPSEENDQWVAVPWPTEQIPQSPTSLRFSLSRLAAHDIPASEWENAGGVAALAADCTMNHVVGMEPQSITAAATMHRLDIELVMSTSLRNVFGCGDCGQSAAARR